MFSLDVKYFLARRGMRLFVEQGAMSLLIGMGEGNPRGPLRNRRALCSRPSVESTLAFCGAGSETDPDKW